MERDRMIAIACAVIAAILVIIAGKSCTDSSMEKSGKKGTTKTTSVYQHQTNSTVEYMPYVPDNNAKLPVDENDGGPVRTTIYIDLFGREVVSVISEEVETEVATDENGEPITETVTTEVTTVETDFLGFPINTIPIFTESTTTVAAEEQDVTTTVTFRDISGYNHGDVGDSGGGTTAKPTLPSDFVITVR